MKKILLFTCIALALQVNISAQTFNTTWAARFQEVLDSAVAATTVKGSSAAVLVPGEGLWTGTSGIASPGVPMTSEKRMCIMSNTKLFIAVVVMKLQELGLLTLEDHLYQWLPSFQYVDSTTTIRQLLSHQSGIFDCINDTMALLNAMNSDTSHFWTPEEILATIGPPFFDPGEGFHYSNTNYLLAGMIIEAATDTTWVQKLHDFIFDPLEMDSTFVAVYESPNGPIAPQYTGIWHYKLETSLYSVFGPFGSIFSTPPEMVDWYRALFNGEIISDSSLLQILEIEPSSGFGLGIATDADSSLQYPQYDHGGSYLNGYTSQIVFDVKTRSVISIMNNGALTISRIGLLLDPLLKVLYNEYPKQMSDAGITRIITPWDNICSSQVIPQVGLKNFGIDPLTSVTIHCGIDDGSVSDFNWTGILAPGGSADVTLATTTPGAGFHRMFCFTSDPNGFPDGYIHNDTASSNFIINGTNALPVPFSEGFENSEFPPAGWIEDPLIHLQWGRTLLASYTGSASVVKSNLMDDHLGAHYNLDLPMLDLNSSANLLLSFTYAYAPWINSMFKDSLKILISSDCGLTWQTLFYDGGLSLATAPALFKEFFPDPSEWVTKTIPLAGYSGKILIRFQAICGYSNNLFIDDVEVTYPEGIAKDPEASGIVRVYPNPVSSSATFEYSLVSSVLVQLTLYNHLGQPVAMPANEMQEAGQHRIQWNAGDLPAGVYFYKLQAGDANGSGKLVLMK